MRELEKVFLKSGLDVLPRVLGLCDRAGESATFGCSDRSYWHYRLTDFPNARFQEVGWLFALAYATEHSGNRYHGKESLRGWARGAWRFWLMRRNADGSVNEVYPNERSFCATAFSAAALVESAALLGGAARWQEELQSAESTMRWLMANGNLEVANQMAASAQALAGFARLTGNEEFRDAARRRRDQTLALADLDGTFPEYGAFDAGYQSITMSALARTMRILEEPEPTTDLLQRGESLLRKAVAIDGAVDASKNSRSTQYIYPHALALLGSEVADRLAAGIAADSLLRPAWMDDRYCIAFAIDYLLAARECASC